MKMFFTLILFVNITNAQSRTNLFKKEELAVTAEKVAILLDEKQPKKLRRYNINREIYLRNI